MTSSLQDLVVVEIAGSVAGAYCAKMFADGGADVIVVGTGSIGRHQRHYLHAGTRSAPMSAVDFNAVDVVIESAAPDPLAPVIIEDADHLVRLQVSPFGITGTRSQWRGSDLTDYAMGGHAYLYGHPDREPLRGPANQPAIAAGLFGFIGSLAALLARSRLGRGQTVDVSHVQVMAALHQFTVLRWQMTNDLLCRMGNRYTGQGQPNGLYRCRDGWVSIVGVTQPQVEGLLAVSGLLHLLDLPDIESVMDFQQHPELMDAPLRAWLDARAVDDVVELFQAMRIPAAPVLTPLELLNDPQLVFREFFRTSPHDPTVQLPGAPFSFSHHQPGGDGRWKPGDLTNGPLAGLQVLDLSRVWAGPLCGQMLAQLGAEVVRMEAPWQRGPTEIPQSMIDATRYFPNDDPGLEPWNRNGHMIKYALGKKSVAMDLQTAEGQRVFARMVPHAHVLIENFSTRVMPQLGFDETRLHQLNPDLIYLTMPGYGRSGPAENWLAYGSCVDSHAGLSHLIGYPDETPWKGGVAWPDPIAGLHATGAVLCALWHGQRTGGGGVTIEAAQFETTVAAIGDQVVAAQIDGRLAPTGNHDPANMIEGIYPCSGDDEWIAITVVDHETLSRLTSALDLDRSHGEQADSLNAAIAHRTGRQDADLLADRLQAAGVPAAKVAKAPDLVADPHLRSRGTWASVDQPGVGPFIAATMPLMLSHTPPLPPSAAPTLGQHNDEVLRAAGLTDDEIVALAAAGVIATEPPAPG